jgi:DNA-binding winged helix-turn-helix (wHTH) protein
MGHRVETLSFGGEFRLETRYHDDTPEIKHRILLRGTTQEKVERRALDLLALFLQHPKQPISQRDIEEKIWGEGQSVGNVHQQVYKLRTALGDRADGSRFIETVPGLGYKFLVDVVSKTTTEQQATPAADSIQIIELWEDKRFISFLSETTRGEEPDEDGDLRIWTVAFSGGGVPDVIRTLLERNVRINILLVNETLTRVRTKVRDDITQDKAVRRLKAQLDDLETMRSLSSQGSLEVRETDVMPCGFVAHNRHGALLGLFLATESYARGPMIDAAAGSRLWQSLMKDWRKLWADTEHKARARRRAS